MSDINRIKNELLLKHLIDCDIVELGHYTDSIYLRLTAQYYAISTDLSYFLIVPEGHVSSTENIDLSDLTITDISCFSGLKLPNTKILDLSLNNIEDISSLLSCEMPKLETLKLYNNYCNYFEFEEALREKFPTLQMLL